MPFIRIRRLFTLRSTLNVHQIPEDAIQLIADTSRETTTEFAEDESICGRSDSERGAGLIRSVVMNSTIPVIETGTGNCHIYVDETADLNMACDIIVNAKTQRSRGM